MVYTVIGIFQENNQVQNAIHALMDTGIDRKYIDISLPVPGQSRGDSTDENKSLSSRIGNFFKSIFPDGTTAARYAAVAQRGTVVAVQAETYEQAVNVASVLDQAGALNVEEEARILEDGMTREDREFAVRAEKESGRTAANAPDSPSAQARVRSQIVDRPLANDIRFHEEELWADEDSEPLP